MNIKQQFASLLDWHRTAIVAVIAVTAWASDARAQPGGDTGIHDVLVMTEHEVPDGNGVFASFSTTGAALNDSGAVAFFATLSETADGTDDDEGIFRASLLELTQIEREFDVTALNLSLHSLWHTPAIDNSGRVAYTARFTSSTVPMRTEIRLNDGTIADPVVAYEGQSVPNGGEISSLTLFTFSRNGYVAFRPGLVNTPGGSTDNLAVYRVNENSFDQIARKGNASPDGDGIFSTFDGLGINDNGEVSFTAMLSGTTSINGVFAGTPGLVNAVVRSGDWMPGGGEFDEPTSNHTAINNNGQVAIQAMLDNTSGGDADDTGIYIGDGSSMTRIAREGDPAPDGNGSYDFEDITYKTVNSSGTVAFYNRLSYTNEYNGVFMGSGGTVTQVARKGQLAPNGNGVFSSLSAPVLNDNNIVAFFGIFIGTAGGSNDNEGIYLSDGVEQVCVVRKGDPLLASTITDISFRGAYDGPAGSGLNESSQVAYRAILANGSEAIVLYTPDIRWRTGASGAWSDNVNWTLSLAPAELYDTYVAPESGIVVVGPSGNTTVKSLFVGAETSGRAVLDLNGSGDLTVVGTVSVGPRGEIRVGTDRILTASALINNGVVSGDGQIDAHLSNLADGEIRVGNGQRLCMSGDAMEGHGNMGKIEVLGGEIEFDGMLVNAPGTGLIAGEDATFRFKGGVFNQGAIALGYGTSRLFGDITNFGTISIGGGAGVTFYDDIVQVGDFVVSAVGGTVSTAVVFGDFTGAGGHTGGGDLFLLGDLRPGNSPGEVTFGGNLFLGSTTATEMEIGGAVVDVDYDKITVTGEMSLAGTLDVVLINGFDPEYGNTFDLFDGTIIGTFDEETYPALEAGLQWNDADLYTTGTLSVVYDPSTDGDIDQDSDVDGTDLQLLLSGFNTPPSTLDSANLDILLTNFGRTDMGGEPVPEPAAWLLLWLGLCCFAGKWHFARE